MKHLPKIILFLAVFISLSACSEGPSFSSIEKEFTASIQRTNKWPVDINEVKVLGCEKATGKPGYICDVFVDYKPLMGPRVSNTNTFRFISVQEGWMPTEKIK